MYKICVFAGTTEGRKLVEFLTAQPVQVTACAATEYGGDLLPEGENLTVFSHRMSREEMAHLMEESRFNLVIDATHPYADAVTEHIAAACMETETEYLRLLRGCGDLPEYAVFVEDVSKAVAYLNDTSGNILLTTGSKQLGDFAALHDFSSRVYARVLPMQTSLDACHEAGVPASHIIAMQGPFSKDINVAMLRGVQGKFLVTKDSGDVGGFEEKADAAKEAGATLVVIGRPPQREGLNYSEVIGFLNRKFGFVRKTKVFVVGIGLGNPDTMTVRGRRIIEQAQCLIGAARMLQSVCCPGQVLYEAIAPDKIACWIDNHPEMERVAVLMSGDTGFFSGTKKLLPLLKNCEVEVLPGISSLSYLCSRLGTSYEDVTTVSLHGREHNIFAELRKNRRVFVLVGGENGAGKLCTRLTQGGFGDVLVYVGEQLSYPEERVVSGTAEELAKQFFHPLSAVLLERWGENSTVTHGLPDELFQRGSGEHGIVPMTKSEVRSICLSKLQLKRDSICWDIGAGTGSVAIEMALQCDAGQVYAVEYKGAALDLMQENQSRLGVENLTVVPGKAPDVCGELPAPSHVFVGGSGGNLREILELAVRKNPSVCIVATAIAMETVAELTQCMKSFDWAEKEIVTLNVSKDRQVGAYHLMTAQNPITIFALQAGEGAT